MNTSSNQVTAVSDPTRRVFLLGGGAATAVTLASMIASGVDIRMNEKPAPSATTQDAQRAVGKLALLLGAGTAGVLTLLMTLSANKHMAATHQEAREAATKDMQAK